MISKGTLEIVAEMMATRRFNDYCLQMDASLFKSLEAAFSNERISQERAERIVLKFFANMKGMKPE